MDPMGTGGVFGIPRGINPLHQSRDTMGQEPDHIPLPRDPPLQSVDGYFMVSQVLFGDFR